MIIFEHITDEGCCLTWFAEYIFSLIIIFPIKNRFKLIMPFYSCKGLKQMNQKIH